MVNESICHSHALLKWNCSNCHKTPSQSGCSFSSEVDTFDIVSCDTRLSQYETAHLWGLGLGGNREKCSTALDIIGGMLLCLVSLTWRCEDKGLIVMEVPAIFDLIFTYETCRAQTTEWIVLNLYARDVQWLPSLSFGLGANESL